MSNLVVVGFPKVTEAEEVRRELVTIQQFSSAYGLLLACRGIANLLGPPFAGDLFIFCEHFS